MPVRPVVLLPVLCGLFALPAGAGEPGDAAAVPTYERDVRPFVEQHCVDCHGPDAQEGGLRLDTLGPSLTDAATVERWIEVMDRLNLGEMPPEDYPQPDPHNLRRVAVWIAAEVRAADRRALGADDRVLMRRMNRTEYANTIRDLLGIQFFPGEGPLAMLPPDGTAEGFDTVSAALTLDPSLLDRYFAVGQLAAERAIVDGPPEFPTETMRLDYRADSDSRWLQGLLDTAEAIPGENGVAILRSNPFSMRFDLRYPDSNQFIPVKGNYTVRVRAWVEPEGREGPFHVKIAQGHPLESLALEKVFAVTETPTTYEFTVPRDPKARHWTLSFPEGTDNNSYNAVYWHLGRLARDAGEAGDFAQVVRLEGRRKLEAGGNNVAPKIEYANRNALPKLWVDFMEVEGPLYEQWPPAGHQLLFAGMEDEDAGDAADARRMFLRLLPKAFRRPIDPAEAEPYVALVAQEMAHGRSFKEALRSAVAAVLTSPSFVFLFEPSLGEEARPLTDVELASRLSYFLWSSMPDEELFALAEAGKLSDPAELERQVDRMLADEKAEALALGFAAQWLRTGEFRNFTPDQYLYKAYDEELGEAMVEEPLAFFREVLRNDEDLLSFVQSDWTMLNERLAEHYGIDGVRGEGFRRVPLPADSVRGGLLGMAGVAMWGSDGVRTKPVSRAAYVREALFNDPPDPPPPNAGEVEPNVEGERLTVRERLEQHQQIAACASCHRGLDPYGLALENFNVIGQWREVQDGEDFRRGRDAPPIDPSGTLPNGESFETFAEYRALLARQDERLGRGLAEKLFVYALGRPAGAADRTAIDAMTARLADGERTLRSLIKGLVVSRPFREK